MRLSTLALVLLLPASFVAGRNLQSTASARGPNSVPGQAPGQESGPGPGFGLGQADEEEVEIDPLLARSPLRALRVLETERISLDMLGAWSLSTFSRTGAGVDQADIFGFLTIADEYLSASLHTRTFSRFNDGDQLLYFQTTMGRYWFDQDGSLFAQSLIGHSNMSGDKVSFEPPGTLRKFLLEMPDPDTLVFVRSDGARLTYARLPIKGDPNAKQQALARRRARAKAFQLGEAGSEGASPAPGSTGTSDENP